MSWVKITGLSHGSRIPFGGGGCQMSFVHRPLWLSAECGREETRLEAGRPSESQWESVWLPAQSPGEGKGHARLVLPPVDPQ